MFDVRISSSLPSLPPVKSFSFQLSGFRLVFSAFCFLLCFSASAQEALRSSLAGQAAAAARQRQQETGSYSFKSGDFRMLVTPSLELDWNDNINLSRTDPEQDFILKPLVRFDAKYPITAQNLLRFNVGVGYDIYLEHSQYSTFRLDPGSEISFDVSVKDFLINLHDRFQYTQDPGTEAAVGVGARYGGLQNTAGLSANWDLGNVVLTLGYDHFNFISSSSHYEYLNRASELPLFRAGLQLHPRLTAGVEASGSFNAYDQHVLNDSVGYSSGVYAEWRPGEHFQVRPRFGYTSYFFSQTSLVYPAVDQSGWYADLTATHQLTQTISYSFSAGRELRLGIDADMIEDWYLRLSGTWKFIKNLSFSPGLSYEHGTQGTGGFAQTYDWFGATLGLAYPITRTITAGLNYRLTLRSTDIASGGYTQNLVGLQVTYRPK
jgi:hypothetical protein